MNKGCKKEMVKKKNREKGRGIGQRRRTVEEQKKTKSTQEGKRRKTIKNTVKKNGKLYSENGKQKEDRMKER